VNRILERLEGRLAPVEQPELCVETPVGARGANTNPKVVPMPVTSITQETIIKYLVRSGNDGTSPRRTNSESGKQPKSPGETLRFDEPDTPPSDVATPRGSSPERVDWKGALSGCQVDWGAAGEADESLKRRTENQQPSGPSVTNNADRYRESRAQPSPLEETPSIKGPDAQPSDDLAPQGDYTITDEGFDW